MHIIAVAQLGNGIGARDARQVAFVFGVDQSFFRASQMRQDQVAIFGVFGLEHKQIGAGREDAGWQLADGLGHQVQEDAVLASIPPHGLKEMADRVPALAGVLIGSCPARDTGQHFIGFFEEDLHGWKSAVAIQRFTPAGDRIQIQDAG